MSTRVYAIPCFRRSYDGPILHPKTKRLQKIENYTLLTEAEEVNH